MKTLVLYILCLLPSISLAQTWSGWSKSTYALLAGRSGGQTLTGGTGATDDLTLKTTSGIGAAGADMHFLVGNDGATEAMTILNNGNVGIGTTTPTHPFDLRDIGTTVDVARIAINNAMAFQGVASAKAAFLSQNMYYDGVNDLRINTANPASRLLLINSGTQGFNFQTVAAGANPITWTSRMFISNSGTVGINETNPQAGFEIEGSVSIGDTTGFVLTSGGAVTISTESNVILDTFGSAALDTVVTLTGVVGQVISISTRNAGRDMRFLDSGNFSLSAEVLLDDPADVLMLKATSPTTWKQWLFSNNN